MPLPLPSPHCSLAFALPTPALLQRVMPQASKSLPAIAAKITIDQFIFAPLCTAAFYFFKVATEGRPRCVGGCAGANCTGRVGCTQPGGKAGGVNRSKCLLMPPP